MVAADSPEQGRGDDQEVPVPQRQLPEAAYVVNNERDDQGLPAQVRLQHTTVGFCQDTGKFVQRARRGGRCKLVLNRDQELRETLQSPGGRCRDLHLAVVKLMAEDILQ